MIEIERPRQASAVLRRVIVTVDGKPAGLLRPGEVARVDGSGGERRVQARIDWCRSEEVVVTDNPKATIRMQVEFAPFWRAFLFTFVNPRRVLRLHLVGEPAAGP